ncbi:hypothetical protein AMS58_12260 [Pseudoalteromonas porphyrae]|uniref:Lipoprotein n=2 Tax=Pseudoalteromonas TaxID=53246 RepID=A0A0N1MUY9_9GAMM|nr:MULTISPECIES: hypothetical protein [Pseudoalteromonas]KPH64535.1 hypothetical protein ADS77_04415 [Pseudoalteromonas porphyrae]KPH94300.1 hypothetical protein AMS58_12260 [Pseudoalteromonas porphyrae]NMR27873.1 hypothetical protein [Pseudoalteromonas sp. NEC-BIFX-2020_015]
MLTRSLCILTLSSFIVACNSEDIETANFGSSYYKNDYTLINTTNQEIDFHMANTELDGDERDVKRNKYYVDTLASGADPIKTRHEHNGKYKISFYVQDHSQNTRNYKKLYKVNNDQDYHFIAWQDEELVRLSLVKNQQDNKDNFFAVRFLATETVTLTVNEKPLTLTQGDVSHWRHVDDCNADIKVDDKILSICHASYSNSYTLVVDKNGIKATITE